MEIVAFNKAGAEVGQKVKVLIHSYAYMKGTMVVYGIPANVSSFAEGELSKPSDKFVGGKNFRGLSTWRGMCPPPHEGPYKTAIHHYQFILRGTDLDPKELPPGLTADELDARLKDHVKGRALLVARFKRPE